MSTPESRGCAPAGWRGGHCGGNVRLWKGGNLGARAAIAVMPKRERDVRGAFHRAGALDPASARGLPEIGCEQNRAFNRLKSHDVIRESAPGCFHFDEETWQSMRSTRLKFALTVLAAIVMVASLVLYAMSKAG